MSGQQAEQGDPRLALLELYDTALPQVYGYLLSRCRRQQLAEDLTAEVFLAAVAVVRRPDPPTVSLPWLIGTARHKLVDHWRRQSREDAACTPSPATRPGRPPSSTRGTSSWTRCVPGRCSTCSARTTAPR